MVRFGVAPLSAEWRDEIRTIPQPSSGRDRLSGHVLQTGFITALRGFGKTLINFFAIPSQPSWPLARREKCIR